MPPMTPRSQSPAPTPASKLPPGSPPHAPHGFKALGRRMSQSKPLRMLKSIASKSSLRGHTRRQSASSVRSAHSQNSEADLQGRDSKESEAYPYGKEVAAAQAAPQGETASASGSSIAPPQQEPGQEGKAQPVASAVSVDVQKVETEAKKVEHEHEAEARQIESVPESTSEPETEARAEETIVAQTPSEPAAEATPDAAQAAAEAVEQKPEKMADHREEETRDETLETDTRVPAVHDADGLSLSSSSTTVDDEVSAPASVSEVSELKQIKMETDSPVQSVVAPSSPEGGAPAEHDTDINPFVLDDPEEPLSEPEVESTAASSSPAKSATPLAESVVLSTQVDSATSSPARPHVTFAEPPSASITPAGVNKLASSPPDTSSRSLAPASDRSSSSSEDEAPELHTPALTVSALFLPIPNTDPLTALLIKHVPEPHLRPPRDLSGEWQHTDFHTLVMTNNWRALARMARDRIVSSTARDVELILNFWYIRLSSLARLRLFNQAAAECENLFSVLATIEPPTARAYVLARVLPFELEVLRARCAYWAGDHIGYLDDMSALLRRCRSSARAARDPAEQAMWKERGARMSLIVASQLVEMKDFTAAATLLEPLCASGAPALRSAIARIYLQGGFLAAAAAHFDAVDVDPDAESTLKDMNAIVRAAAEGNWQAAAARARALLEREPENVAAINNYAVALLGMGRVKEGIQILADTLQASPSATTTTEPYLFNLSTMYELRAALTVSKKRDLLIEVAKWSGDGLRTACLKLNS